LIPSGNSSNQTLQPGLGARLPPQEQAARWAGITLRANRSYASKPQQPGLSVLGRWGFVSQDRVIAFGNGEVPDEQYEQSEE